MKPAYRCGTLTIHDVARHRTPNPSQSHYTDTGYDTPPSHTILTQDITPHPATVY